MTYRELAELLKVEEESARRRAQRARWPRRPGNDGKTRVAVPGDVAPDDARTVARDDADDGGDNGGDVTPALIAELAELRERLGRAEGHAAAARAEIERIQADRDHERAERQGERQAAEAERARLTEQVAERVAEATRERDRAEGALIRAAASEAEAKGLREALEEARRPFWRRWIG